MDTAQQRVLVVASPAAQSRLEPLTPILQARHLTPLVRSPHEELLAQDKASPPVAALLFGDPDAEPAEAIAALKPTLTTFQPQALRFTTLVMTHRRGSQALLEALHVDASPSHILSWHDPDLWHQVGLGLDTQLSAARPVWGPEPYMGEGAEQMVRDIRSSLQRDELLAELSEFARARGVHRRINTLVQSVADEFIINAVYNAPVDDKGVHRYARQSRTEPVFLPPEDSSTLRAAFDDQRLVLSVVDPFGSLSPRTVWSYLVRGLRRGDDQIEYKEGGAGLGLFTVLESTTRFAIQIRPGQGTEMLAVFERPQAYRLCLGQPKSLKVCFTPPPSAKG